MRVDERVLHFIEEGNDIHESHSGLSGGTYIYYYYECRNSKYTTKTDVMWNIVKR